ncbi:hypothetical protein AB4114_15830 [Paenibacillus sp. 2RAB27]|uniref:hypothetical protein n=1 Tax=Paenibacillus sp. 2RAB27 TaxID=3232991 RepID=UPI003F9D8DA3
MGYNLNITRARSTFEAKENPITLEEWKAYVALDPELDLQEEISQRLPDGQVLTMRSIGMAVWIHDGHDVMFRYSNGLISLPYPPYGDAEDSPYLPKIKSIASKLNARVLGDEQEEF